MSGPGLLLAAALLAPERLAYVWVWRHPKSFEQVCARWLSPGRADPVESLHGLFWVFKALQIGVFLSWCWLHGGGALSPASSSPAVWAAGGLLLVAGQTLNLSVFWRLGKVGVFYGNRFGHAVPWCSHFPFSVLRHPQYAGTVVAIWGFFVLMRFPEPDWIALPLLETLYYVVGNHFEQ